MKVSVCAPAMMAVVLLCAVAGCGGRGKPNKAEEESALKPIAMFYGTYVRQHQGMNPPNAAEFKAFLKEPENAARLKDEFKVTDVDKLFISPRDNEPYVIIYGSLPNSSGPGGAPVVAYEKVGLNGKRFVASALGGVVELEESAFRAMVPLAR